MSPCRLGPVQLGCLLSELVELAVGGVELVRTAAVAVSARWARSAAVTDR